MDEKIVYIEKGRSINALRFYVVAIVALILWGAYELVVWIAAFF